MITARYQKDTRSVLFHVCYTCGWSRYLVEDTDLRMARLQHKLYGQTTYLQLAQKDVRQHICDEHQAAQRRARGRREVKVMA